MTPEEHNQAEELLREICRHWGHPTKNFFSWRSHFNLVIDGVVRKCILSPFLLVIDPDENDIGESFMFANQHEIKNEKHHCYIIDYCGQQYWYRFCRIKNINDTEWVTEFFRMDSSTGRQDAQQTVIVELDVEPADT